MRRFFVNNYYHPPTTLREEAQLLQAPIDSLIALADNVDDPNAAAEADRIIQNMKEVGSRAEVFTQLEHLALLTNTTPEAKPIVTDTAELLLEDLNSDRAVEKSVGLNVVWSAIHAWDKVRDPVTAQLCIKTLDSFRGEGQHSLALAYRKARDKEIEFDDALEEVLTEMAA